MLLSFCQVILCFRPLLQISVSFLYLTLSFFHILSHCIVLLSPSLWFFFFTVGSRKSALVPAKQTLADTPYQPFYLFNLFPEQRMRAFYPSLCLRSVECGYEWEEQAWIGLVLNAWTPLLVGCLQMTCSSLSCDIITYRFHYIAQQIFMVEVKPELNKRDFWNF